MVCNGLIRNNGLSKKIPRDSIYAQNNSTYIITVVQCTDKIKSLVFGVSNIIQNQNRITHQRDID